MFDVSPITILIFVCGIVIGWLVRPSRKDTDTDNRLVEVILVSYLQALHTRYGTAHTLMRTITDEDRRYLNEDNRKRLLLVRNRLDAIKSNHI